MKRKARSYATIRKCSPFMRGVRACIEQNRRNNQRQCLENKRGNKECMHLWHTLHGSNSATHIFSHYLLQHAYLFFDIICGEKVVKMLDATWNLPSQVIAHILKFTNAPKYLLTPKQMQNGHVLQCQECYEHAIQKRLEKQTNKNKKYRQKVAFSKTSKQMLISQYEHLEKDDIYNGWMDKINKKIELNEQTLEKHTQLLCKMQLFYKNAFHISGELTHEDVVCTNIRHTEYSPTSPCYPSRHVVPIQMPF